MWLWKLLWPSSFQAVTVTVEVSRGSPGPGTKGLLSRPACGRVGLGACGWEEGQEAYWLLLSLSLLLEAQLQEWQLVLLVLFFDLAVTQTLQPSWPAQSCCPRQPCPVKIGIAPGSSPAAQARGSSMAGKWGY